MGKTERLNNNHFLKIAGMEGLKSYKLIVELAEDAIFIKDLESRYILVNKKAVEALGGLPRKEILGKSDYELLPPEQAKINIEDDQMVFKTGKPVEITKKMSARGKEFYFHAIKTPLKDKEGKVIGLVGIARDITQRKLAEEAIRDSEERYRVLFGSSVDGILIADIKTRRFRYANPAICRMLGYEEEELKKMGVKDIHPKEVLEHVFSEFEAQANGEKTLASNIPCLRKDGTVLYADINAKKSLIDGRECNIGFFRDVTDRKQAEEALKESESNLREQKLSLEQKNIALREVIAQIEVEKNKIKDDVSANVNELLLPILKKLRIEGTSSKYVDLIQYHLEELTSSFGRELTKKSLKLTPREVEICSLVKGGLTSKDVSNLLSVSCSTVERHRKNIRKKLGITKKGINLTSFLQTR